jgi:diguanylate cyclase (GGDEF)-like protein/PAS domain S-box-containing protein
MANSLWKWWLGVGGTIVAVYPILPSETLSDIVYLSLAFSVPMAITIGIRRFQPTPRAPWYWVASANFMLFGAEILWFILDWMGLSPYPSAADVLSLIAYPCLAVGLALLVRHRTATRELSSLLDAAIVSIGAGIITWVLLVGPVLGATDTTTVERLISLAYPMLDLLVISVVARLALGGGAPSAALAMLGLGLVTNLTADFYYVFVELTDGYVAYGILDSGWLLGYTLIGAAVLHPSMARLAIPSGAPPEQVTPSRLVTLTVASVTAPLILLLQWLRGAPLEVPVVAIGAIAMFVLVVARVSELGRLVAVTRAHGEARFRSLVHNANDVIIVLDGDGVITYTSPAINRVWQHRTADILDTPFTNLLHPDDIDRFTRSLTVAVASTTTTTGGTTFDGRIWSSAQEWRSFEALTVNLLGDPSVNGVVLTCRDTTERVRLEAQLTHQAFHDPLTGLANRALFLDRVEHALGRLARGDQLAAVLFIDLDDFKTINDGLGHTAGDALLAEVSQRLTRHLRPGDTAARLGGDEFSILVEDVTDHDTINTVAQRLIAALQQPITIDDVTVSINASVGIAVRDTTDSAHLLIRDADIAMYDAKTHGKGRYAWFDPPMRAQAVDRWKLRTNLAAALPQGQLFLVYQPIIKLDDGSIVGAEALLRWRHPTRGIIPPDGFVPIAEQTGMITEIGDWVLRTATMEATRWQTHPTPTHPPYVSVNVSAVQLRDDAIVARVRDALARSELPPDALVLELTESAVMDDVDHTITVLHELKDLGVAVAVDDFGTGYSSLAYLRQFPVDLLKIDRSFVTELGAQGQGQARSLAEDILTLATALNLPSVAEGIETPEQLIHLQAMNCALGQGYHLGAPMDSQELVQRLDRKVEIPAYR